MRRLIRRAAIILLIAMLVRVCWIANEIWSLGNRDLARPSDCAIVLGAAVYGSMPSPVFKERIRHSIELHRRGLVAKIIFTGGRGAGATHTESEVAAEYAVRSGIPKEHVLTETRSHTTRENVVEAKAVMAAYSLQSAVIVSDPLHLRRAAMMAEDLGIQAVTSPTPTTRYRSLRARLRFLLREVYFFHH